MAFPMHLETRDLQRRYGGWHSGCDEEGVRGIRRVLQIQHLNTMKTTNIAILLSMIALAPVSYAEPEKAVAKAAPSTHEKTVPAPGSLASLIHDGVTFSILAKAVKAAELEETLSGKGPFTIFAPTDEAFGKLPSGTIDKLLLPENKEKLRSLLTYHIIPGQMLSTDLKDGNVKSLSGDKLQIDVDGKKIEVDTAKVVNSDVTATNGVFHVIDKVIVPKSLDGFAGLDHDD
jgi:uncharacterized surface protein with fasciclin (FAS1) repeats